MLGARPVKTSALTTLFASAIVAASPLALFHCNNDDSSPGAGHCHPTETVTLDDRARACLDQCAADVDAGKPASEECFGDCATTLCGTTDMTLSQDRKTATCHYGCSGGRRPDGLVDDNREGKSPATVGAYFAKLAHLEAASVHAFRTIADELVRFGAPEKLVRAARRARRDEVRHTRMTSALARRFGAALRQPRVAPTGKRALVEFALENAVEGCVSETFGALLAHWQAQHAEDREVRSAMARIARDETRHASLAWQMHRWATSRLGASNRRRVSAAMRDAAQTLLAREVALPAALARTVGMPGGEASAKLLAILEVELWSEVARGAERGSSAAMLDATRAMSRLKAAA